MLPTIAQPLASTASGAAQPHVAGVGPRATPEIAAAAVLRVAPAGPGATGPADAFVEAARVFLPGAAGPPAAIRPRSTGAGYAASASGAALSSADLGAAAKKAATAATNKAAAATSAKSSATKATASAKKPGPLAFLDDKKLSVEEKLMRLLAYLSAKWDKDLEKKMKEFEAGQQKTTASSSSKSSSAPKKSGGVLGSIGSAVKAATAFFPAAGIALEALKNPAVRSLVSKLGGPVLGAAASALGFPTLAPLLVKYAPALVDAAAGIATSLDGAAAASAPARATSASGGASSASSSGGSPSDTGMNDSQMRLKMMEIQRIMDVQKEMFSAVSNILRSSHETRMSVVQNIR